MPRQHRLKNSPNRRRTKNLADVGQNITDRCQPKQSGQQRQKNIPGQC